MNHIFISYSRKEKSIALEIEALLRAHGFNTWIDRDIEGGVNWESKIEEAVINASAILVLVSESSLNSEWVQREVRLAEKHKRNILPMVIQGSENLNLSTLIGNTQLFAINHDTRLAERVNELARQISIKRGLSEKARQIIKIGAAFLALTIVFLSLLVYQYLQVSQIHPDISLLSLRFMASDYNPRFVDLRTAETLGIPATINASFQFDDFWVWASSDGENYSVNAEVYVSENQMIGSSATVPLTEGAISLGAIQPSNFQSASNPDAWLMSEDWDSFTIVIVLYQKGVVVERWHFPITIETNSSSWLSDSPNAYFAAIVYSVNDGERILLDLREAESTGIQAVAGDQITLHEVWYHASVASSMGIRVSAYTTSGGYNPNTEQASGISLISDGIHALDNFEPIEWTVAPDDVLWVVSLARDDVSPNGTDLRGALLDRLLIPIN